MNESSHATRIQHVYDFAALDRVPDHPTSVKVSPRRLLSGPTIQTGKSSTVGAVLSGARIIVTLGRQAQGTGAKAHTHPNEQFNYILEGTMMSDVEGDRVFATPGMILHTPGMAVHTGLACPDEDLVFLAIKDTRHGIVGPPVDGKYDGPNCFPGFGSRAREPKITTAEAIAESKRLPRGPGKRYVYDMREDSDAAPEPASARVTPGSRLNLPAGIRAKLLSGELLHVAVLHFAAAATLPCHAHDNEQFTFVAQGMLEAELDADRVRIPERCVLHVPPGVPHALSAPRGAIAVIAQDTGSRYAA